MVFSLEMVTADELVYSRTSWIDNISQISGIARSSSGIAEGSIKAKGYLAQSHYKR